MSRSREVRFILDGQLVSVGDVSPQTTLLEFIRDRLGRTGTKEGNITITTPLIHLRKKEIVALGLELNAPFHLTWSCYTGAYSACGECESCVLRLRAFREAGASDPIPYAHTNLASRDV